MPYEQNVINAVYKIYLLRKLHFIEHTRIIRFLYVKWYFALFCLSRDRIRPQVALP